jgi:arylsulfatase A-like enzyme
MASGYARPPGALTAAGMTGLAVGALDVGSALWDWGETPFAAAELTPYLAAATAAGAAAYIVAWLAAARPLARTFGLREDAACRALAVGVVGAYIGFLAQGASLDTLTLQVPLGLLCAALAYAALARARPGRGGAAGRLARGVVGLLFAAAVLSPLAALAPERGSARAVTQGHRVERVILVVVDTLRADALSCYSPTRNPTPNVDRLAAESLLFTGARSPSPWTLPSVASLMTGASPLVHRTVEAGSILPASMPTLAERMSAAGYRTAAFGRATFLLPRSRLDRGFDEYRWYPRLFPEPPLGSALVHRLRPPEEGHADRLTEMASEWIEEHADEDFFLWLHYFDVHLPYTPPFEHRPQMEKPEGAGWTFNDLTEVRFGRRSPSLEQRRWIRELYEAEARYFDEQFAALLETLERLGLYEDTLIVLTSDHGEEFWEHEGFEHGHTLYDEVIAVPLLVKLPGRSEGRRVDGPVSTEDVAATILTACGLPHETGELLGSSLITPDGAPAPATEERVYVGTGTLYYQDRIAVIEGGLKYVRFLETGDEELYDLARDPGETTSLVATEAEKLAAARRHCDEILEAAGRQRERFGTSEGASAALSEEQRASLREMGYVE